MKMTTMPIKYAVPELEYTPENITELRDNEIFVYGDNLAHVHGAGAALTALKFGAKHRVGHQIVGQTYGISTKAENVRDVLPLLEIYREVLNFLGIAANNPDKVFLVTKIGCGLANPHGMSADGETKRISEIAPFFKSATANVVLPKEFHKYL